MAKRNMNSQSPPIESKTFRLPEIDAGIRKLQRRIEEVKALDPREIPYDDARVATVTSNIRETIREVFGTNSPEYREHRHHEISRGESGLIIDGDTSYIQQQFAEGIPQSVATLTGLIARLEEKREDLSTSVSPSKPPQASLSKNRRVFVVHGHDEEAKLATARFLEQLQLEPIILSEKPNEGRTIIEKFEHHADVSYAIILLTPDDMAFPEAAPDAKKPRARQNVILELGYFIGRFTRSQVCALYKDSVELPSDLHGVLYVHMDPGDGWKLKLAKEMKAAGLEIDMNLA